MFTFLFPALALAGVALMAAPLLIHLINMMRHQRVKWAAMDFLLKSYKKNRNYVWLKQLLLLLMRMAAMLLLGLLLAGMGCHSETFQIEETSVTRHLVLLDDSFSMDDRVGGDTAFERAKRAIERIGAKADAVEGRHEITVLRYSAVSALAEGVSPTAATGEGTDKEEGEDAAAVAEAPVTDDVSEDAALKAAERIYQMADVSSVVIDSEFGRDWLDRAQNIQPSQLSVGPRDALQVLQQMLSGREDQEDIVYVVSDFRTKDWSDAAEVRDILASIKKTGAAIQLINCVEEERPNVSITRLEPEERTQAAGVPLFMKIDITNSGKSPAINKQLKIESLFFDPLKELGGDPQTLAPEVEELPVVLIPEIKAGETVTRRVQVHFPKAGTHVVRTTLSGDALSLDNERYCVVHFPEGVDVLVIDGSTETENGYFLSSIFEPELTDEEDASGPRTRTGIKTTVHSVSFLRDKTVEDLEQYRTIYLCDVPRLDTGAVKSLEQYVKRGGGLGVFVGPNVASSYYNSNLYVEGTGLMPVPLSRDELLPEQTAEEIDESSKAPDINAIDHPVFEGFGDSATSLARFVSVDRYMKVRSEWTPEPDGGTQVLAKLRNGDPFAIEKKYGDGRVVAVMTTAAPQWNSMAFGPALPVMTLNMQSYLESARRGETSRPVASPIELEIASARSDVKFIVPAADQPRLVVERTAKAEGAVEDEEASASQLMKASIGRGQGEAASLRTGETDRAGIYEGWWFTSKGQPQVKRIAMNVETSEGRLEVVDKPQLKQYLESSAPEVIRWDEIEVEESDNKGANMTNIFFVLLALLLLVEQVFAYFISYHPAARGATR